jgi:hypothetical protein
MKVSWFGLAAVSVLLAGCHHQQKNFVNNIMYPIHNPISSGWLEAEPIGEPCKVNPTWDPGIVELQTRNKSCSIVVVFQSNRLTAGSVDFENWNIVGEGGATPPSVNPPSVYEVVQRISEKYGAKYVLYM